jgi:hypothetical protein
MGRNRSLADLMAASNSDRPFVELDVGEFHDQDGVFGGHADQHDQGDLGKNVVS